MAVMHSVTLFVVHKATIIAIYKSTVLAVYKITLSGVRIEPVKTVISFLVNINST